MVVCDARDLYIQVVQFKTHRTHETWFKLSTHFQVTISINFSPMKDQERKRDAIFYQFQLRVLSAFLVITSILSRYLRMFKLSKIWVELFPFRLKFLFSAFFKVLNVVRIHKIDKKSCSSSESYDLSHSYPKI